MQRSISRRALGFLRRRPAPDAVVALYLSARFRCIVSPSARIEHPDRVRIGRGSRIGACRLHASGGGIDIGENCEVQDGAILDTQGGSIRIGRHTAIGPYSILYGFAGVDIGDECAIAGHNMIVSSHHTFHRRGVPIRGQAPVGEPISIGSDVWIGANCVIIAGAKIGSGCVIGASSLVRGTVADFAVAVGSPARTIRYRREEVEGDIIPA